MATLLIIAITVACTLLCWRQPAWQQRLMLWPPGITRGHQVDRLLTHGFVHADGQHLLFNMITLFFFGRAIEPFFINRIGAPGYALFYASAVVVAALPSFLRHRNDANYASLGASGAVSAITFGFVMLSPWSMIFVFFLPLPAILYAVLYIGYSIWADKRGRDNINHNAHLWGALYGMAAMVLLDGRVLPRFLERLMNPPF